MAFTNETAEKILNKILRSTDFTDATDLFISIHSADPGNDGLTAEITGYTGTDRPAITFNLASTDKVTENDADIDYLVMPAITVTHAGLFDQAAHGGGVFWWSGALAVPRVVAAGDTFRFPQTTGVVVTLT